MKVLKNNLNVYSYLNHPLGIRMVHISVYAGIVSRKAGIVSRRVSGYQLCGAFRFDPIKWKDSY